LGGGLNLFNKEIKTFEKYLSLKEDSSSISSNMVSAIYEQQNGNLWIGTFDGGLNLFDIVSNKFLHYTTNLNNKYSINHNQVMDIIEYSPDTLLIATFGGGVNLLDTKTKIFRHYQNGKDFRFNTQHKNVRKLFDDGKNIWIGSYNGLYKYSKKNKNIDKYINDQNNPKSINNNKIRGIFKNNSELIFIGTTNGANILNPRGGKFDFYPYGGERSKLIGEKFLVSLSSDNSDLIWAGSIELNNSSYKKKRKIKYYGDPTYGKNFKSKSSINLYEDESNILWIGDYDGLKYFDPQKNEFESVEFFNRRSSYPDNNFVKSFYFDSKGDLWAGTLGGGLTYFNVTTKEAKRYIHLEEDENTISDSRVLPIFEDSENVLWIGTYGGLNRFARESETFIHYTNKPYDISSISNDRIYSILETKQGELWIGTYQGLNKYIRENDNFEQITIEDGLADNTIYGILEDESEYLWIRTNKGISKYSPKTKIIKNYSKSDGLEGIESNGSVFFKNKFGRMFFGATNGYYSFYPSMIKDYTVAPSVVFTELQVMDEIIKVGDPNYLHKSLNEIDKLKLSHLVKVFTISFAALDYSIPSKNKYAYMLEGFRDKWSFVNSNNRSASFTNLNPGEYTLHVKASNSDGIWNEVGRSLQIIITPPYWETWWFRMIAILVLLFIVFLFYEYRLYRLLEIERTRARIARNLHDDVGGTLASIQYFVDAVRKSIDKKNIDKFLDLIMASSNDAQEKIRDIIWTVNPKEDGLSKFLVRFNRFASDLFDSHGISYIIDFPRGELEKKIEMEKRQHLWCICKETVTNIIRHSKCNNVKITFKLDGNTLEYVVEDDGIGFNKNTTRLGNGLTNMSFRAEKLHGDYAFETSENEGMKIGLSIKI